MKTLLAALIILAPAISFADDHVASSPSPALNTSADQNIVPRMHSCIVGTQTSRFRPAGNPNYTAGKKVNSVSLLAKDKNFYSIDAHGVYRTKGEWADIKWRAVPDSQHRGYP